VDIPRLRGPEGRAAMARAAELLPQGTLRALETLRGEYDAGLARDALSQAALRARAAAKFGPDGDRMLFTPDGLEQATRPPVAAHRAARLAGRARVVDLCCGIGGDLMALAEVAGSVAGVERDPAAAVCAAHNVSLTVSPSGSAPGAQVVVADVTTLRLPTDVAVVVDPARRSGGRRTFDPSAYSPPLPWALDLLGRHDGVVKVAPGIPHAFVPAGFEAEWVSWKGGLKEAALWSPALASAPRRATLLPSGATVVGHGAVARVGPLGGWLHEPDPAVIRAGLVAEVAELTGARLLDPTIAYLTSDGPLVSPYLRSWQVTEAFPFGVKPLRAALRARGIGSVTVKKRGTAVDPDQLRRDLRLPRGGASAVVVLTRIAGAHYSVVCEAPCPGP
jgi:hypothetical protein